jgi:hypothetical protein
MSLESDLINYLWSDSALTTALGGKKVFFNRVPGETKMPWVEAQIIWVGFDKRLTQKWSEITDEVVFTVDDNLIARGRTTAGILRDLLNNYRGNMGNTKDAFITCSTIRAFEGFGGSYRYVFNAGIRYKEETKFPSANN